MEPSTFDVIVADDGFGSLAAGYLLAARGRTVAVVNSSPDGGTRAVNVVAARRIEPLRAIADAAAVVRRRAAKVLQPEGMLSVAFESERLTDGADGVVLLDRASTSRALLDGILALGGRVLAAASGAFIDESGAVVGITDAAGARHQGRWSLLPRTDIDRLGGMTEEAPIVPSATVETEWTLRLDSTALAVRFSLADGEAAEWWLYGDPFDGAMGFGRIRAFESTVTLCVVVPLAEVVARRLSVAELGERLRSHPSVRRMLKDAVEIDVNGWTHWSESPGIDAIVGDGWVAAPCALPTDTNPLTTEIAMAQELAAAVDAALDSPRTTAARLASLPARLQWTMQVASQLPLGPMDGWADELVRDPARLAEAAKLLANRFGDAR